MNGMTNRDFLLHNINTLIQALQTLVYIGTQVSSRAKASVSNKSSNDGSFMNGADDIVRSI